MSNRIRDFLPTRHNWLPILLGMLSLAGLYVISRHSFLLFHCLAEAFSIIIAIAVFAIFWNTRRFLENGIYLIIGYGCLFAGLFDLIYIFAYQGMSVFPGAAGNLALQGKTVAQWYVSLSCVCALVFVRRKIHQNLALAVYSTFSALALGAIFYWRVFPDCYVEGVGQTPFERMGLVISCSAYLGALVLLVRKRREFDSYVFQLLAATLIVFFVEDFASALATDLNGFAKAVAHLCQVVALFLVYKAFVEVGLRKPYDLLFRSQQQTAEALERQRQFLEAVLDNVQSGIVACDAEGALMLFNRAARELHRMPLQTVPAEQWAEKYDLYRSDGTTHMRMEEIPLFRALRGEWIRDVEMTIVPKAGSARVTVSSGSPLVGKDGLIRGAVVSFHDVTDRKQAEETLRQSEARYRLLADNVEDFISLEDGEGKRLYVSPSYCRVTGWTPEEIAASDWRVRMHPDDLPHIERAKAAAQTGATTTFEHRIRCRNGSWMWVVQNVKPVLDPDGKARNTLLWAYDITERKRAEQALAASEARNRLLVETIPQLAWRLSPDGLDTDCNQRWYEYTGQTPAQVCGGGWLAAVHPDDLRRATEQALHAVNTQQPYEVEYRLRRASDASYRWHLVRSVPVLGEDGRLICWIGSATDIEELKQAQEILKQAHDEQLQRHRAELAHVARLSMMGEMAASLAHELNQPLHAVMNYAYGSICRLEQTSERDEELVVALEQISEETTRAAEIIRRIKRFVQKRELRFSEVFVNALVEEAVLLSKAELGRHHAKIILELAEGLPTVIGDAIQIEQVIMNLVRNGLEAMDDTPNDDRLLGIKTLRQGENAIQVDVRDCGTGIDEENLKKAFEPFFTTKAEGMGMGLAISRSIVQAHRGRIWATVNEAQGCTFHFTLPIGERE